MRRRPSVLVAVAACALAISACGQADSAGEPETTSAGDVSTTSEATTDAPPAAPTEATVVSVEVEGEQREPSDAPAPLPTGADGVPSGLDTMNASVQVVVVDDRTVEVRFSDNRCRAIGRVVDVVDDGGTTRLLVTVGTTPECVPDPDSTIPAVEAAIDVPYVVQVELDADLAEGSTPVAELVV